MEEESGDERPVDYEQTLLVAHQRSECEEFQLGRDKGYHIERSIGRGHFGVAFLVKTQEGKRRVLKALEVDRGDGRQEAEIMRQLRHPHIIRFRDSFEEKGFLAIVMDHAACGDLLGRVDAVKKSERSEHRYLQEEQVRQWFAQALLGLRYLHGLCIVHRDLKNENLFLESEDHLRIGDFGLATKLKKASEIFIEQQIVGTPLYLSPEICAKGMYSTASDIWALGCSLYELLCLSLPFEAANLPSLLVKIAGMTVIPRPNCKCQELSDLCLWLLTKSRMSRPSAVEVLQHNFLQPVVHVHSEGRKSARKVGPVSRSLKVRPTTDSPKGAAGGYPLPSPARGRQVEVSFQRSFGEAQGDGVRVLPGMLEVARASPRLSLSLEAKYQHHLQLSRSGSGAFGSPLHWLRRSGKVKEMERSTGAQTSKFDEALMESQPTLKLVEAQVSNKEDHRLVLEAEVLSPKVPLPGVAIPPKLVKRSKSSGALDARTPRLAGPSRVVPPPLKFGKLQRNSSGSKSARNVAPNIQRIPSSAKVTPRSARQKSPNLRAAPPSSLRKMSKEVPSSRAPSREAAKPSVQAVQAPVPVRLNPLRAVLKGAAAFRVPKSAGREVLSRDNRRPRAASATPKDVPKGDSKAVVQPLLLRALEDDDASDAGPGPAPLRRSPSAPPLKVPWRGVS